MCDRYLTAYIADTGKQKTCLLYQNKTFGKPRLFTKTGQNEKCTDCYATVILKYVLSVAVPTTVLVI